MLKFLQDLILFYQTETASKITGVAAMMILPMILIAFSLSEKAKLARSHFANRILRKYHLAQAQQVAIFLIFSGASQLITYAMIFRGLGTPVPLWVGIVNIAFYLIALRSLICLEATIAAVVYAITNLTLVVLLDSYGLEYQVINAVGLGVSVITSMIIGICYFWMGDPLAQKYLQIKTTSDLKEKPI